MKNRINDSFYAELQDKEREIQNLKSECLSLENALKMMQVKLRDSEISCNQMRIERDKLLQVSSDLKIKLNQNEKIYEMSVDQSPREEQNYSQFFSAKKESEIVDLKNEVESLRKILMDQIKSQ